MKTPRALPLALGFLALFSLSLSCATTGGAPGDMPPAAAPAKPPAPVAKVAAQEPEPAAPVVPERPPPARVTAALAGEPVAALREARLETTSCDDYWEVARKQALIRVRTMRAEVDASLQSWVDSQPSCWQEYQWQEEQNRRYAPRAPSKSADMGAAVAGGSVSLPSAPRAMATSAPARPGAVGSAGSSAPRKADSASGTNNQVVGVDEADIVKTDGRYVYLAMNGALRIVEALNLPRGLGDAYPPGRGACARSSSRATECRGFSVERHARTSRCTYGYDCQLAGDGSAHQDHRPRHPR
jgi:hypothetical protein